MMVRLVLVLSIVAAIRAAEEVCYNRLGCFINGPPYSDTLERPISHLPWPPGVIDTQFLLFTRSNPDQYQVIRALNVSSVFGTNFKPSLKSLFIIHGFLEMGAKQWLVDMCQTLLKVSDVNCFCVDWRGGSFALYTQSANNVRVVGAEIAYFLGFLQAVYDYHMSDVYLVGHSLGAHIAGEAGKRLKGIGRISGLDPAGPYFVNTPPSVRLSPTDAVFVDAIHTDGSPTLVNLGFGGYGMLQPSGNVDFYPNGGEQMPGCDKSSNIKGDLDEIVAGLAEKIMCNHHRSVMFFAESILRPDGFVGYPASSYKAFQKVTRTLGFAKGRVKLCAYMGYKADEYALEHGNSTINQKFFLDTGDASNFLRWRYDVSITVDGGFLLSGSTYSSFIDVNMDLNPVRKVEFVWHQAAFKILHPKLGASSVDVQYGPSGETYKFCGGDRTEENTIQTLEECL
ncbi:PREDICTED: pancreatic lipase-related protein 2-like [Nanorana parkeri]|uniref:pancreatic lipase-related protein 2-like n=1 Tax=Nanorana parkeri TaxID=125878 RepID=UPI000854DB09|nr:PREDICTED: pancreatic lipase-related protein 2-like [Nanorana parkeri]